MPAIKSDASDLVRNLLSLLLDSDQYGERRGAAYGLAGLIKGLGILALKQLDIMNTLTDAMQDKKNPKHREGMFSVLYFWFYSTTCRGVEYHDEHVCLSVHLYVCLSVCLRVFGSTCPLSKLWRIFFACYLWP